VSSFSVTPAELEGAASTLGAVDAVFRCPAAGQGGLGSPELEAAVQEFNEAAAWLSQAMGEAIQVAGTNAAIAAAAYVATDVGAMPGGR
jgi:hypothetical protein